LADILLIIRCCIGHFVSMKRGGNAGRCFELATIYTCLWASKLMGTRTWWVIAEDECLGDVPCSCWSSNGQRTVGLGESARIKWNRRHPKISDTDNDKGQNLNESR
jgi:hypothetical protein